MHFRLSILRPWCRALVRMRYPVPLRPTRTTPPPSRAPRSGMIRMHQWPTYLLSACMMLSSCARASASSGVSLAPPSWTLAWSDEFAGAANARVDSTRWRYDIGDGCTQGGCGWGNGEKESYTSSTENASLNGTGQLMITARRSSDSHQPRRGRSAVSWTSWRTRAVNR